MLRTNRYLFLASVIGCVAIVCLMLVYRQLALSSLVDHETRSNTALTRVFSNSVWPRYRHLLDEKGDVVADGARGAEIRRLAADVKRLMRGSRVVKVKIYDLSGVTLYSSDPSQIGEDKSTNAGFVSARSGQAASNVTYRDQFDAFEERRSSLNVVSSYIPILDPVSGEPEAVFEVYSDVSDLIAHMREVQWTIFVGVLGSVALLYLLLVFAAKRADRAESRRREEAALHEARIRHQAYHDPITGLPNRTLFLQNLERAFARADRLDRKLGVMYLDVDRFKLINDSLGHDAGDELLCSMASRLRRCLRQSDALYRMGGDEFTVLPEDVSSSEEAAHVAQRILDAMKEPFVINGRSIVSGVSIGISIYPDDDADPGKLVKNADAAMYLAKKNGRNRFCFYTSELDRPAMKQLALESSLQKALDNNEYVLLYQPRLARDQKTVLCFEALIRWQRSAGELVLPGEFIPELEHIGLISEVGKWVLREACKQCKAWRDRGYDPVRVSVNVSPRQLREADFCASVEEALAGARLDARFLELELTENSLLDDPEDAIRVMRSLKDIGVVLSVDDFGVGYSSFNYLKLLPVDYLKIDKSFVSDLDEHSRNTAIVAGIAGVARSLGIGLVAEGVEEPDHSSYLIGVGCDELQGFLYSPAVFPSKAEEWLSQGQARKQGVITS